MKRNKVIYKIEYGKSHFLGKKGVDYHHTRIMGKSKTIKVLRKLNKKWDYTTVFRKKGNKQWDVLG